MLAHMRMLLLTVCLGFALTTPDACGQLLKIQTTPTCFRAFQELSEAFAEAHPNASFKIDYGGACAAVEEVGRNETDLGCIEYPLRKFVAKAWEKAYPNGKAPAAQYIFAQTALGVVVNKKNSVSRLTHEQLRDILAGNTTSWRKVGGSGGQIKVITSKAVSRFLASDLIVNYRQWSKGTQSLLADSNVIASVQGDGDALGFVALIPDLSKNVKAVAISQDANSSAVQPTVENVVLQKYSLVWQYKMILSDKSPPEAHDFVHFACSEEAAKIVQRWGLFPVAIRNEAESEQRVADMKAGKGTPIRICGLTGGGSLAQALAVAYVKTRALVRLDYEGHSSVEEACEGFIGSGELLLVQQPLGEETAASKRWPVEKTQVATLGTQAVGVIVHPGNGAKDLTLEDLRLIYSGEVEKWPGVEGAAARIRIFGLANDEVAMKVVEQKIGGPGRHARIDGRADTGKVVLSVANQPGAIGFVELAAVPKNETSVKLVAIVPAGSKEAEPPTPNKVPEGYPLTQPVMLYLSPKASETAKDFFEFVAEGNARDALLAHGIIPYPNPPKFTRDKTLAAVKKHIEEEKPAAERPPMAPGAEELAIAVPKGPVAVEEEETKSEASPPEDTPVKAEGRTEGKSPSTEKKSQKSEASSDGTDTKFFIFGMAGLLIVGATVIGFNAVAAKRRRERLRKYRR